jgi:hypothetical protein
MARIASWKPPQDAAAHHVAHRGDQVGSVVPLTEREPARPGLTGIPGRDPEVTLAGDESRNEQVIHPHCEQMFA